MNLPSVHLASRQPGLAVSQEVLPSSILLDYFGLLGVWWKFLELSGGNPHEQDLPALLYAYIVCSGTETKCPGGAQDVTGPTRARCPTFLRLSSITFQPGSQSQPAPEPAWIPEPRNPTPGGNCLTRFP